MATVATDVVSVEEMKRELGDPGSDALDDLVQSQIESAVSYVSTYIRAPLLDTVETFRCHRPDDAESPLYIRTDYVTAVAPVRYWLPGTAQRLDPDGTIAVADLGRRVQLNGLYQIWPPEDGWPEVEERSLLEVDLTRAAEITQETAGLRHAVILVAKVLYFDGSGDTPIKPPAAMNVLLKPWRNGATP